MLTDCCEGCVSIGAAHVGLMMLPREDLGLNTFAEAWQTIIDARGVTGTSVRLDRPEWCGNKRI